MVGSGSLAQAGRSGPSSILDGPPPHPQYQSPMGPPSAAGLGAAPARTLPQEQVLALMASGQSVGEMLDTMAQMAPDIAAELAGAKELLQRGLAKLMIAGGGLTPPATGGGMVPGMTPGGRMG